MTMLVAHFRGGPDDPCTARVAGCLPAELRYPAFVGRPLALIRTERVYDRVGEVKDGHATYQFRKEVIVHGG